MWNLLFVRALLYAVPQALADQLALATEGIAVLLTPANPGGMTKTLAQDEVLGR